MRSDIKIASNHTRRVICTPVWKSAFAVTASLSLVRRVGYDSNLYLLRLAVDTALAVTFHKVVDSWKVV